MKTKKLDKDVNKAECFRVQRTHEEQLFDSYYKKKFVHKNIHLHSADKDVLGLVFVDAYTMGYKACKEFYMNPINGWTEWLKV